MFSFYTLYLPLIWTFNDPCHSQSVTVTLFMEMNAKNSICYVLSQSRHWDCFHIGDEWSRELFITKWHSYHFPSFCEKTSERSSINHVVNFLSIFYPPPSWSLLLNKAYVIKWSTPPFPLNCPSGLWMTPQEICNL